MATSMKMAVSVDTQISALKFWKLHSGKTAFLSDVRRRHLSQCAVMRMKKQVRSLLRNVYAGTFRHMLHFPS